MNNEVGKFLRELRIENKLSQKRLAEKMHIDRTVIVKSENGEREPSIHLLMLYSKFFNIPMSDLLTGKRQKKKNELLDKLIMNLLKTNNRNKVIVAILSMALIIVIICFSTYLAILNYTSTKIYTIDSNDNIEIVYGTLTKTRDRVYMSITYNKDLKDVSMLDIYFVTNDEKRELLKMSPTNNIYLVDNINNKEYVTTDNYNDFINNTYLEFIYNDDTSEKVKLDFSFDYTNKKLTKEKSTKSSTPQEKTTENKKSELYDIANKVMKEKKDNVYKITYNKVKYEVFVYENKIDIINSDKKKINYKKIKDYAIFSYLDITSNKSINYSCELIEEKCFDEHLKDIELFENIIKKL